MKWCGLATSLRMSALGLNCGKRRTYSEPARLRDQLSEGRDRKILTDLNQKTKNKKSLRTLKPNCGWSKGVRAILGKSQSVLRRSRYHQQSVQLHRDARKEGGRAFRLVSRSTGTCLADVNGDQVEAYLLEAGVLHLTAAVADAPANWACDAHHHE
jgi:monothiol glutaredoxin